MKVLVLDDDSGFVESVVLMLSANGHEAEGTQDVDDAIARIELEEYDVVFVDYKMPERDGIWFMRNVNLPAHTKAILVTAYVNRDVIKTMFDLGVSGYLIKPFGEDDLIRHLDYIATKPAE